MTSENHPLQFQGYWLNHNVRELNDMAGIFCIYTCIKRAAPHSVIIDKLIYIGESSNVCEDIYHHPKKCEWKNLQETGQRLCFSFCAIDTEENRKLASSALILKVRPILNDNFEAGANIEGLWIGTYGKNHGLPSQFTVK